MVYVVNTAHEATPVTYLSGSFNDLSLNIHFKVKDIILAVCGTVACMFTLCMLITFTRCCCRKNKDTDSETDDDGDAEHAGSRKSSVKHSKSKVSKSPSSETAGDSSVTHVIVESTGEEYLDVRASHRDKDKLKGKGQSNLLSVKDRIKAFERQGENPEVKLREGKPKRKKPSSKAFEEFESQGILIGFGNVPKRRHTEYLGDGFEEDEADEDYISNGESYRGVRIRYPSEPQLSRNDSLRREIGEGADEDDEFAAVQRNSDILKSFRRAPPPKNRTRARRSGRRRPTSRMDQDRGGRIEEELPRLPSDAKNRSVTCGDSVEHEDFEQSLHMPTDKSASSRSESLTSRQSDNSDPVKTSRGSQDSAVSWEDECTNPPTSQRLQPVGASQTKVDCDEHEYEYTDIPRPRSQSESSNPALRPQRPVSYHSSHALSNTSENNNISDGQPFTYHKPPVPRHDRGRDRHVLGESRSHTSLVRNHSSPATRRLDFSPAIRRWESEHCELRNVKMVAMDTEDFHDDDWHADGPSPEDSQPHVYESLNYPKTDRLGRKFRSDEKDVNKTYPKSEKLNRKMMTTSMTSPPNLLYRPYYQSDEPQFFPQPLANGHHPQPNISEMSNGSQLTSNGYQNTRVVVCFNIDTKPTSV